MSELKFVPSKLNLLAHWINERENIRQLKNAQEPKPWTRDPILQAYRFCNVVRMEDKVSLWLWANWYQPNLNHRNMLVAVGIARFFNQPTTLNKLGFPKTFNEQDLIARLRHIRDTTKGPTFNSAYMVRGNDGCDKVESVISHNVKHLVGVKVDTSSMENTWGRIKDLYGFGSFMAGQIVADLRWALDGSWKDKLTWAPVGPGSSRGMLRLLDQPPTTAMKPSVFVEYLQRLMKQLRVKIKDSRLVERMEAHDYQNCLCEFDKYERVRNNEGRPKQKYPGV